MSIMFVSMSGSVSSIKRFAKSVETLQEKAESMEFKSFENMIKKVEKEIRDLNETNNELQKIDEMINKKNTQCDEKINKFENEKSKLEDKIKELQDKIKEKNEELQQCPPTPGGAARAAILMAEIAKLTAELAASKTRLEVVIAELKRLDGVKKLLEQKKKDAEKLKEEMSKSISKFEEGKGELEQAKNAVEEAVQEIASLASDAQSVAEQASCGMEEYMGDSIEKYQAQDGTFRFENKFILRDELKHIKLKASEIDELGEETSYSNTVLTSVRSVEEARFYKSINLQESVLDGKPCLKQSLIDFETPIEEMKKGVLVKRTNLERMLNGEGPLTLTGEKIELHHVGQNPDSPLAELTVSEHRRGEHNKLLHTSIDVASKINRHFFAVFIKKPYWKARGKEYVESRRES